MLEKWTEPVQNPKQAPTWAWVWANASLGFLHAVLLYCLAKAGVLA